MPDLDHTGPNGMGSRSGRGRGNCRGGTRAGSQLGMSSAADTEQGSEPGMGQGMGQNMGQGRCCRHGQRHNSMTRNCAVNGEKAGMARAWGTA